MLQSNDVVISYGERQVLKRVSLHVPARGLVGILGPNGSGKTTLLKVLSGALLPESGSVTLDQQSLASFAAPVLARRLAVVPQETHLAFDYSVMEIVLMGRYPHLSPFEFEGPTDLASAHAALAATGTDHLANREFNTLSGGEKQRVVIASALAQLGEGTSGATAPGRVLLLDEPTASLDLRYQFEVAALLRRLHDRQDMTIVLTTHDVHFAARVCSEVALLGDGQLIAQGPPPEVLTTQQISSLYRIEPEQAALFAVQERS